MDDETRNDDDLVDEFDEDGLPKSKKNSLLEDEEDEIMNEEDEY